MWQLEFNTSLVGYGNIGFKLLIPIGESFGEVNSAVYSVTTILEYNSLPKTGDPELFEEAVPQVRAASSSFHSKIGGVN